MELGPTILATVAAVASAAVAVYSARSARVSQRETERLRYELQGLGRLHEAVGPLRLELFLTTRSVARRLRMYHDEKDGRAYELRTTPPQPGDRDEKRAYHDAGLLLYRLLRPLTLSELIEHRTHYTDLALDPTMVDVLRFHHAAMEMLSGEKIGKKFGAHIAPGHSLNMGSHWEKENPGPRPYQRVRSSYLRHAAAKLQLAEGDGCVTHSGFLKLWDDPDKKDFHEALDPVKECLNGFEPKGNPVLWLRLVGYAHACKRFHDQVREHLRELERRENLPQALSGHLPHRGFQPLELPTKHMLSKFGLGQHAADCEKRFDAIYDEAL